MAGDSDSLSTDSAQNKRLKTLNNYIIESQEHQESPESMEESHAVSCGICFMDKGKSIRGQINCCDHYFCFVCVMEWAKIESRCPLCKCRFTTIRRPPKEGVFPHERIVQVPKRDQIQFLLGNDTIGLPDPYAHVHCSVCCSNNDENLILLCDLCDMASHTYCVGLDTTVPEGDWFCQDCTVLRDEHNNAKTDSETDSDDDGDGQKSAEIDSEFATDDDGKSIVENSRAECKNFAMNTEAVGCSGSQSIVENSGSVVFGNLKAMPSVDPKISIFDIVHDKSDRSKDWRSLPRTSLLSRFGIKINVLDNKSSVDGRTVDRTTIDGRTVDGTSIDGRTDCNTASSSTEFSARTLLHCRNVHSHIRALRKNWNSLQNRSLSFCSFLVESGVTRHKRYSEVLHDRSNRCTFSSGCSQQQRAQGGSSADSHDIKKAWKMMKTAKSMLQKSPYKRITASKQSTNRRLSLHMMNRQQLGNCDLRIENQHEYFSLQTETENCRSLMSDCRNQVKVMRVEACEHCQGTSSTGLTESPLYRKTQTQYDAYNMNGARLLAKTLCRASSSVVNEQGGSCLINLIGSVPGISILCNGKSETSTTSSGKVNIAKGNGALRKNHSKSRAREDDHAKSEIQSLVKLNLKLLSKDKRLECDAFKKVARLATHTILGACGLERPKIGVQIFQSSTVCSHGEHIQQLRKSTLMPNSCRECFYAFVKDVVHSIMLENVDHGRECL